MKRYRAMQRRKKPRHIKKQTRDAQKRLVRWVLFLVASILLVIFFFGDHGLYQLYHLRSERKATQLLIAELRKDQQVLEAEKTRLKTDSDYLEQLAREKYRMAKPGEKVFKVFEKESTEK